MSKLEKKENRVKAYGVIIGIVMALLQHGIYTLANVIAQGIGIESISPKIPAIDNLFPLLPIFIIPYVWSYLFWAMAPMAASKCKLDHFLDHLASYLFACLFGALILIFIPTYMDRVAEGLYSYPNGGFFYDWLKFWYSLDGSEMAFNLFPSFHCINSTIAYLAVAKREEVPKWFRIYSFVMMILIFFSTLFVKQHFIMDVFSGILIALISFFLCKEFHVGRIFNPAVKLCNKIFSKKEKA